MDESWGQLTFWPYLAYARSVLMHIAVDGILTVFLVRVRVAEGQGQATGNQINNRSRCGTEHKMSNKEREVKGKKSSIQEEVIAALHP